MGYPQNIKVTVDAVVFSFQHDSWQVLLIQRKNEPFKDQWAIPGGFVEDDESLDQAAGRELEEETGVNIKGVYQFFTFGQPQRDPRARTISVAYLALIDNQSFAIHANTDAKAVQWFPIEYLPSLAFDHDIIIKKALTEIQWILAKAPNQTQNTKLLNKSAFEAAQNYLSHYITTPA